MSLRFNPNKITDENKRQSHLLQIPNDVLLQVFSFFNKHELAFSGQVCQDFYRLSRQQKLINTAALPERDYQQSPASKEWKLKNTLFCPGSLIQMNANLLVYGAERYLYFLDITANKLRKQGVLDSITTLTKFSDTEVLVGFSNGQIQLINVTSGQCSKYIKGEDLITCVMKFSDTTCVSGTLSGALQIFDLESGQCVRNSSLHKEYIIGLFKLNPTTILSVSTDGAFLLGQIKDGAYTSNKMLHQHTSPIACVAKLSANQIVFGLRKQKEICILDINSGALTVQSHQDEVSTIAVISKDKIICKSSNQVPAMHDLQSGEYYSIGAKNSMNEGSLIVLADGNLALGSQTLIKVEAFPFQKCLSKIAVQKLDEDKVEVKKSDKSSRSNEKRTTCNLM